MRLLNLCAAIVAGASLAQPLTAHAEDQAVRKVNYAVFYGSLESRDENGYYTSRDCREIVTDYDLGPFDCWLRFKILKPGVINCTGSKEITATGVADYYSRRLQTLFPSNPIAGHLSQESGHLRGAIVDLSGVAPYTVLDIDIDVVTLCADQQQGAKTFTGVVTYT